MNIQMLALVGGAIVVALVLGGLLGWTASRMPHDVDGLVERINSLLPQTQCGQCLFPGCRPYAAAIARGDADFDRCPPGGAATAEAIARLLDRPPKPPDPSYGVTKPRQVAWIDEERCTGCARCLPVCPVDAIVGAPRLMHTVIASQCTGCELCLAPCPVDCIEMRAISGTRVAGSARQTVS